MEMLIVGILIVLVATSSLQIGATIGRGRHRN